MSKKKTAGNKDQRGAASDVDFEYSLRKVEQIVARLEGGQLGLSESLQQYELGIRQLKLCHELLDAAEQRVNVLAGFDAEGNPLLEPLHEASGSRKAGRASRSSQQSPAIHGEAGTAGEDSSLDDRPGLF